MTLKVKKVALDRWWDIWVAVLILSMATMVGMRLYVTEWTPNLYVLVFVSLFAGLSGAALGYSSFSPLLSAAFSSIYGLFITAWLFGTTVETELSWRERIFNLIGWRLRLTIEQFSRGENLTDPILFLTIMALLLWIIASLTAFILIRRGMVWPAILPLGITLLVVSHYDQNIGRNARFLMSFLFFALLLIGRMTFLRYRQRWQEDGFKISQRIMASLSKTILILSFVLLVVASIIPLDPLRVSKNSELWKSITDRWLYYTEQVSEIFTFDSTSGIPRTDFFSNSMGLGSGSPDSEDVVFTVKKSGELPPDFRLYWRARSYDYYENGNWSTNPDVQINTLFPDNFNISYPEWVGEETATFTFSNNFPRMINLYTTGVPVGTDRPVEAVVQSLPRSEEDLVALMPEPDLSAGETYQIEAVVDVPSMSELRDSSSDYPAWLDRYLQLPDDFSPRIQAMAERISERKVSAYSKTFDITRYLRINMNYSRTIPPVPLGADPIEWFLFEEKTGFCNYYATAQVLMLRSLGIPARIAVGYTQGEYDPETETYIVRRLNSHAWPEVYFVDYGWVIFEPTTPEQVVVLPSGPEEDENAGMIGEIPQMNDPMQTPESNVADPPLPENSEAQTQETSGDSGSIFQIQRNYLVLGIITLFMIPLAIIAMILIYPALFQVKITPLPVLIGRAFEKGGKPVPPWIRRWSRNAQLTDAEKAYRQLGRSIRLLGQPLNQAQTPAERAQILAHLLPDARDFIRDIVYEYTLDQYSPHKTDVERAKSAARYIRKFARSMWLQNLNPLKARD
ncbi:MAG: transglutaminaseTgpA domain-containing protein [Brevefilum sp.]